MILAVTCLTPREMSFPERSRHSNAISYKGESLIKATEVKCTLDSVIAIGQNGDSSCGELLLYMTVAGEML